MNIEKLTTSTTEPTSPLMDVAAVQESVDRLKRQMDDNMRWSLKPMYGMKMIEPNIKDMMIKSAIA